MLTQMSVFERVVPENVIQVEMGVLSGALAGAFVTNNGERRWKVVRFGVLDAGFEMVARTSTSDGRHERSVPRTQAARR